MEYKIHFWCLDDESLSDDYITVLKDLKKIVEAEKTLRLKIKPTKCQTFFPGDITEKQPSTILALCPWFKTPKKVELINLDSPLEPKLQADLLKRKKTGEKVIELLKN